MIRPIMKHPTFNWSSKDKYAELLQNFNISQTEGVSNIKNWLGRQGLQLSETLMQVYLKY